MSTCDFSALYATLPYNLIKDKLIDLIERTFNREGIEMQRIFLLRKNLKKYQHGLVEMYVMRLPFCSGLRTKLYRQEVGIPMGTNCAPLVANLFLFCYERDLMMSFSDDKQDDIVYAFNTTSRYLDDILNIDYVYFDNMVTQLYPSELQLNKDNTSDTEAAF